MRSLPASGSNLTKQSTSGVFCAPLVSPSDFDSKFRNRCGWGIHPNFASRRWNESTSGASSRRRAIDFDHSRPACGKERAFAICTVPAADVFHARCVLIKINTLFKVGCMEGKTKFESIYDGLYLFSHPPCKLQAGVTILHQLNLISVRVSDPRLPRVIHAHRNL